MVNVRASISWPGSHTDVLRVFVEPTPDDWGTEVYDADIAIFRELDSRDEPTGDVAGIEIVGFLSFDRWEDLPKLNILWQLPEWHPLPLDKLLKRVQKELQGRKEREAA